MNRPRKCPECHNMYKKSGAHRAAPFVPRAGTLTFRFRYLTFNKIQIHYSFLLKLYRNISVSSCLSIALLILSVQQQYK